MQSPPLGLTRCVVLDVDVPLGVSLIVESSVLAGGVSDLHSIGRPTGLFVLRVVGDGVSVTPVGVHHDEAGPTSTVTIGHNDPIATELGLACLFVEKPLVAAVNVSDVKIIFAVIIVKDGENDLAPEF